MAAKRRKRKSAAAPPKRETAISASGETGLSIPLRRDWLLGALLVLAILAAYATALRAGYIWDDDGYLTRNPLLNSLEGLRRIWFTTQTPQYYPLVFTTFWIEHHLWGLAPFGYHLINVLLHAANAILVWRVLRRLGVPGAWLAGALFGLHPVHVESVAWVTERKNVISGLFYLLALRQYLIFEEVGRRHDYAAALALFVCALLSKSVTATLPAVVLLLAWWRRGRIEARDVVRMLPFFAVGAASGLFTASLEVHKVGAAGTDWALGWAQRFLLAGTLPWFYLSKLLWPAGLAFTYPRWKVSLGDPLDYAGLAGMLLAALALWRWHRRCGPGTSGRAPAAAALFFVLTLGPVLGFLNVYPMRYAWAADHFQYLASLGPIALAAAALAVARRRWGGSLPPAAAGAGACALLLALGALTLRQGRIYAGEETLWRDTLRKNPASWMAHTNLGRLLAARGETKAAIAHYREALRLRPGHANALNNLGNALARLGKPKEAEDYLRRALRSDPSHPLARSNLGRLLIEEGRVDEGVAELRAVLERHPRFPAAHVNLGTGLLRQGKTKEAARQFTLALDADPSLVEAGFDLAVVLTQERKYGKAIALLREGLRRNPKDLPTAQLLAWLLASAPRPEWRDGREALRLARGALRPGGDDAQGLSILAAAYAELGRFEDALRAARGALRAAEASGSAEDAARFREMIRGFERGRPHRLPSP